MSANNRSNNNPPAQAKRTITREEWERRMGEVRVQKTDMNKLIMNYLVIEGHKDAAEQFSREASLQPSIDLESISDRMHIRSAIQRGGIDEAIERVNDLDPEILDNNPKLYFHLQQQRLIEFIRNGQIDEAIEFAQEELAPRGEENPEFLEELEKTMALLAFEIGEKSPLAELLDYAQRHKTAAELNAAILTSQCQDKDPKLPVLLKMLTWAQQQLDDRLASYPRITDLVTGEFEARASN